METIKKTLKNSIDYLGEIEANYITNNTALEILSYAHPLKNDIENLMRNQIDWNAPGAVHRIQPDELDSILESAAIEVKDGFQKLKAQTLIGLWTGLEIMIEDLFVAWMLDFPDCMNHKTFQKIKIPLAEFCALDEESRIRKLYKSYIDDSSKPIGIERFESVLVTLGLPEKKTEPHISKSIYEINHLRNLFAHQGGRIDRKFQNTELGKTWEIGGIYNIHDIPFRGYCSNTIEYVEIILERIESYCASRQIPHSHAPRRNAD